jgi:hypothetical protein
MPSMKILHYLLWDKPVVANAMDCNRELLVDHYNSLFYSGTEDLKNKLELLSSDKGLLERLSAGARQTKKAILENWDPLAFLREYDSALKERA